MAEREPTGVCVCSVLAVVVTKPVGLLIEEAYKVLHLNMWPLYGRHYILEHIVYQEGSDTDID